MMTHLKLRSAPSTILLILCDKIILFILVAFFYYNLLTVILFYVVDIIAKIHDYTVLRLSSVLYAVASKI